MFVINLIEINCLKVRTYQTIYLNILSFSNIFCHQNKQFVVIFNICHAVYFPVVKNANFEANYAKFVGLTNSTLNVSFIKYFFINNMS